MDTCVIFMLMIFVAFTFTVLLVMLVMLVAVTALLVMLVRCLLLELVAVVAFLILCDNVIDTSLIGDELLQDVFVPRDVLPCKTCLCPWVNSDWRWTVTLDVPLVYVLLQNR
eukprot:scaffold1262_cov78-Skeletonema_dohrnii-CCMP3373.AAC.1